MILQHQGVSNPLNCNAFSRGHPIFSLNPIQGRVFKRDLESDTLVLPCTRRSKFNIKKEPLAPFLYKVCQCQCQCQVVHVIFKDYKIQSNNAQLE